MIINYHALRHFDWLSFILTFLIGTIGLLFVFSATYSAEVPYSFYFKKQAIGLIAGLFIYLLFCMLDYRLCMRIGYFSYLFLIGLLIFTLLKGSIGMGGQRWINLFFFKIQPSEMAKLLFPTFTSYYLYTLRTHTSMQQISFRTALPILIVLATSFILIAKQPDLGTALTVLFSAIILLWIAGLTKRFFIYSIIILIIGSPLFFHLLKPYQKQRIAVFLGYGEKNKSGYQIEQSMIAIGSGGLTGKGFLQGTQNKFHFLPEGRTDFIFAVLCEEWGLAGSFFLMLLFFILFMRSLQLLQIITDPTIQVLAAGTIIHIMISTVINVGMVLGLLPVVGIPLPLISYGLSNLLITYASLGWFHGIIMQQRDLKLYATSAQQIERRLNLYNPTPFNG